MTTRKVARFPLALDHVLDAGKAERGVRAPTTANAMARRGGQLPAVSTPFSYDGAHRAMVQRLTQHGIRDTRVLTAMREVPRHLFLDSCFAMQAYADTALPIGARQTISQPHIVAYMIEQLLAGRERLVRVLEIGTGCGYQAAVLSRLVETVYSVERIRELHELAKTRLRPLRIANIRLHYGDGMVGLDAAAPFDAIILAASGLEIPEALLQQLTTGGRLIAPVGAQGHTQVLTLIERTGSHDWIRTTLGGCAFVPLCPGVQ